MFRTFIIIIMCLITGCAGTIKDTPMKPEAPYIEIQFSLNKDAYPMLLGFLKTCYPQIAVWMTEPESSFQKTIYITERGARNSWILADARPSATPVWNGIRSQEHQLDIDGISGATPSGELHTIIWPIPPALSAKTINIYIEANVSFDYNDYYSDDESRKGYSGVNGQPSLIWKTVVNLTDTDAGYTPIIIGHGNVNGADSQVHEDLTNVTTARNLFNYIKVHYSSGS